MIDHFFHPNGVAIIGATDNPAKGGYHILRNTLAGYKGRVYPVNPRYEEIQGTRCYPNVESIPEDFDLAIYFIPAKFLPDTIKACAKKGVKAIIIESAGFSEVGEEGWLLQRESVELARSLGIRLWGPNCMGLLDGHSRNVFSFMYSDKWMALMKPGGVSLVVQSGMLSAGVLRMFVASGGMGLGKVCSLGNKCDVDEAELPRIKERGRRWMNVRPGTVAYLGDCLVDITRPDGTKEQIRMDSPVPGGMMSFHPNSAFLRKGDLWIVALANAVNDTVNSVKQATEFGLQAGGQELAALLHYQGFMILRECVAQRRAGDFRLFRFTIMPTFPTGQV